MQDPRRSGSWRHGQSGQIDPFVGTGTFPVRLLQSGLIKPEDLARKYASELHANEIVLLAYYIAAVNVEAAYAELAGDNGGYQPFEGIVLVDTFQLAEGGDTKLDGMEVLEGNSERAKRQSPSLRITAGRHGPTTPSTKNTAERDPFLTT